MSRYRLENEQIILEVDTSGAELKQIWQKMYG